MLKVLAWVHSLKKVEIAIDFSENLDHLYGLITY